MTGSTGIQTLVLSASVRLAANAVFMAGSSMRRLGRTLLFWVAMAATAASAAPSQLAITETELMQFIDAAGEVATWRDAWTDKLGKQGPSDNHLLEELIGSGADGKSLDAILQRSGVASLGDYIALERRLSEIYHALYADTSALAVMAVSVELAVKGKQISPVERARMIKHERLAIEHERRASVAPETIEIVSRHALALARALGDIW